MGRDAFDSPTEAAPGVSSSMLGSVQFQHHHVLQGQRGGRTRFSRHTCRLLGPHPRLDLQGSDQLEAAKLPLPRMMEACAACLLNGLCAPMPTEPEWGMAPNAAPTELRCGYRTACWVVLSACIRFVRALPAEATGLPPQRRASMLIWLLGLVPQRQARQLRLTH